MTRVALTALGCKVNFAEMAELAGKLAAAGLDVVGEDDRADVRVLNSCTVTLQADATTRQRLHRLRRDDPEAHLILTGCSVDANPGQYSRAVDAVFDNGAKPGIADYIVARFAGRSTPVTPSPLRSRAFLKIQDGCDHRCTYCIVWRARGGHSRSLAPDEVLRNVDSALRRGHRELVLTGVDLGSYGREHGTTLAALLHTLLDRIGDARVRLSSVNANDVTPQLAELNAHPRLCAHWHMPLQSASDEVLKRMHRGHRMAQYRRVVERLRSADPRTELTTDLMVGFPGETEDDHRRTVAYVAEAGFLHCHVFRWSPRPDTPAATHGERVDDAIARRRSAEVRRAAIRSGSAARQRVLGSTAEVVWERVDAEQARGLTDTWHTAVATPDAHTRPGALRRVRLDAVAGDTLRATLLAP
ncbi:MAG TPA: MiaB/RimO family radical SAM methylthiotransferase [Candidatus Angelobacter sp.]|jgi:threonylcarbamoyladenosine tRNA methylthiotransferase MtaB|nr:MiaB/RimO family radical SAM methylthiotransferase [Candidatus Angelobacter sp.]